MYLNIFYEHDKSIEISGSLVSAVRFFWSHATPPFHAPMQAIAAPEKNWNSLHAEVKFNARIFVREENLIGVIVFLGTRHF